MINLLPAVLIGGPSYAGKSALFYNLTRALSKRQISHHALRAYSTNGDTWSQDDEQEAVRLLRIHDTWNDEFIGRFRRDLSQRLLPLLIDIDTHHPTLQTCILQQCTHTVLLLHEQDQANTTAWLQLSERYALLPLAHIYSSFEGKMSIITAKEPIITGTLMQSDSTSIAQEALFDCLVERIAELFSAYSHEELAHMQLSEAPTSLVLQLSTLLQTVAPGSTDWEPPMLGALLDYIPACTPLSVYGQAPQWLYSALAAHTGSETFYLFDPHALLGEMHAGWVAPPELLLNSSTSSEVHITYTHRDDCRWLTMKIMYIQLDYLQATSLVFPPIPPHQGLILAGNIPTWLLTALVRLYIRTDVPWIAYHQAQQNRAIVIFSRIKCYRVGDSIPPS
jgi:CRISPR-associated protein Csx3